MGESFNDDEWTPPTAADMKIIEARQERSNQISKLMGAYMLKGYRMLDKLCSQCGTILLQDRQQVDYCVACSELETECAKDDPALSSEAARAAAMEGQRSDKPKEAPPAKAAPDRMSLYQDAQDDPTPRLPNGPQAAAAPSQILETSVASGERGDENKSNAGGMGSIENGTNGTEMSSTISELKNQISWATNELRSSSSVESSIQLCNLIKACSEALIAISKAQNY